MRSGGQARRSRPRPWPRELLFSWTAEESLRKRSVRQGEGCIALEHNNQARYATDCQTSRLMKVRDLWQLRFSGWRTRLVLAEKKTNCAGEVCCELCSLRAALKLLIGQGMLTKHCGERDAIPQRSFTATATWVRLRTAASATHQNDFAVSLERRSSAPFVFH